MHRVSSNTFGGGVVLDAVGFVTYLYATTADGLPLVADRAVLVPTLHDEPPLTLAIFDELFGQARFCLFSTPEERVVARRAFRRHGRASPHGRLRASTSTGGGRGEVPPRRPGIKSPYALYVGRLDPSKGVTELVQYHARYRPAPEVGPRPDRRRRVQLPGNLRLSHTWICLEGLKHDAFAGAEVVVCPSPYESLSFLQLEAWTHGRPTFERRLAGSRRPDPALRRWALVRQRRGIRRDARSPTPERNRLPTPSVFRPAASPGSSGERVRDDGSGARVA